MQKRFIDFIMQHLINNKIWIFLMSVCLTSCNHLTFHGLSDSEDEEAYFEEYETEHSSEEKYEQIYCTPEDERKGIKTNIDNLYVACGRSQIEPNEVQTLEIKKTVTHIRQLPSGGRIPEGYYLVLLKSGDKVLQELRVGEEGDPFWREVVFVKIRKGVYWQDLNNDGYVEFAVLRTDTGNAIYRRVEIYTLKEDAFHFYGIGKYIWHAGQHVLLNCPKCWKFDLDECKKCL